MLLAKSIDPEHRARAYMEINCAYYQLCILSSSKRDGLQAIHHFKLSDTSETIRDRIQ